MVEAAVPREQEAFWVLITLLLFLAKPSFESAVILVIVEFSVQDC